MRKTKLGLALAVLLPVLIVSASAIVIVNSRTFLEAMVGGSLVVQRTFIIDDTKHDVTPVDIAPAGMSRDDVAIIDDGKFPVVSDGALAGDWILRFTVHTTERTPSNTLFQVMLSYHSVDAATGAIIDDTKLFYAQTGVLTPGVESGIIIIGGLGPVLATPDSFVLTVQKL